MAKIIPSVPLRPKPPGTRIPLEDILVKKLTREWSNGPCAYYSTPSIMIFSRIGILCFELQIRRFNPLKQHFPHDVREGHDGKLCLQTWSTSFLYTRNAECSRALITDVYESLKSVYFPTRTIFTWSKKRSWLTNANVRISPSVRQIWYVDLDKPCSHTLPPRL